MRVVVLGAAGRTGRELVAQASAAGHEVVAFAPLAIFMVWIGVHPSTFLTISEAAVARLIGG